MSRIALLAAAALTALLAACTAAPGSAPTAQPSTAPTTAVVTPSPLPVVTPPPASASLSPTASPIATQSPVSSAYPEGSVIVTFTVEAEEFKALLTDPADVAIAEALLADQEAPSIPNGVVVQGDGGFNAPWTWHLDPETIEFADMTVEVCDGLPSYVEDGTVTSDRYCPWGAQVVAVEPANP